MGPPPPHPHRASITRTITERSIAYIAFIDSQCLKTCGKIWYFCPMVKYWTLVEFEAYWLHNWREANRPAEAVNNRIALPCVMRRNPRPPQGKTVQLLTKKKDNRWHPLCPTHCKSFNVWTLSVAIQWGGLVKILLFCFITDEVHLSPRTPSGWFPRNVSPKCLRVKSRRPVVT